jgi:phage terminase large subunit-like protein
MLNCSRQSGKSTITAILALHHALNNPRALLLVLSPSLRQSGQLFKKVIGFYRDLGKPIPSDIETNLTLELRNKSRIISLPGKEQTVRGFSGVSLLIIDEALRLRTISIIQ